MSDTHDGIWIRDLRRRLGLSQVELASRLGVSNVTVNRWERGKVTPELATIRRIVRLEQQLSSSDRSQPAGPTGGNLPVARNRFLGRQAEIAALRDHIERERLVTLVGPAGSGKTRLAVETGRRLESRFPDGVWFVDLSSVADERLIAETIAVTLGVRGSQRSSAVDRIVAARSNRGILLIVDNCEHVITGAAATIAELLARLDQLVVLATSRAALEIAEEQVVPLGPLPVGVAAQLFRDRAERHLRTPLPDEHAPAIEALCQRLDCLPLAIELASARTPVMTPAQMLTRIDDRFSLLAGRATDKRQATLRAALDWSHDLLTEEDRIVFRRVGIFAGAFDLDSVESICHDDHIERSSTLEAIERLIHQSLLSTKAGTTGQAVRYVMLESIREYARLKLDESAEHDELTRRHARRYLTVAREAGGLLNGANHLDGIAIFDRERDDLAAALTWAIRCREGTLAVELGAALWPMWQARGRFAEGARRLDEILGLGAEAPGEALAEVLTGAATLRLRLGEHELARSLCDRAMQAWQTLGRNEGEARVLDLFGLLALRSGHLDEAERLHRDSFAISSAADDRPGLVRTLTLLGQLTNTRGDSAEAERHYTEAWTIARKLGNLESESVLLLDLGDVAAREGRFRQAVAFYEQSLAMNERLGNPDRSAAIVANLAEVRICTGEVKRAVAEAADGVARYHAIGNRAHLADALYILGAAHAAARDDETGLTALREALGIYVDLGNEVYAAHTLELVAQIATRNDAARDAAKLLGGAAAIRERHRVQPYALFDYAGAMRALESALGAEQAAAELAAGRRLELARLVLLALSISADPGLGVVTDGEGAENGRLTARQADVLRLVAAGSSNREIADALGISERTVERHLSAIYIVLEVDRRSSAVAYAVAHGLHREPAS